jgi:hypothetical protein
MLVLALASSALYMLLQIERAHAASHDTDICATINRCRTNDSSWCENAHAGGHTRPVQNTFSSVLHVFIFDTTKCKQQEREREIEAEDEDDDAIEDNDGSILAMLILIVCRFMNMNRCLCLCVHMYRNAYLWCS